MADYWPTWRCLTMVYRAVESAKPYDQSVVIGIDWPTSANEFLMRRYWETNIEMHTTMSMNGSLALWYRWLDSLRSGTVGQTRKQR